jgi:transposase
MAAGLTVVMIESRKVRNLRGRHVSSEAKDDGFDAFVLADALRTDRAWLRPLVPDSPQVLALRETVRARKDLVARGVAVCNRLRAHLQAAFPGAIGLFSVLDSRPSLATPASSSEKRILRIAASLASRQSCWPKPWTRPTAPAMRTLESQPRPPELPGGQHRNLASVRGCRRVKPSPLPARSWLGSRPVLPVRRGGFRGGAAYFHS